MDGHFLMMQGRLSMIFANDDAVAREAFSYLRICNSLCPQQPMNSSSFMIQVRWVQDQPQSTIYLKPPRIIAKASKYAGTVTHVVIKSIWYHLPVGLLPSIDLRQEPNAAF